MLHDDLNLLYNLISEENVIKENIKEHRLSLILLRENIDEVKDRILTSLNEMKHKYAKCKDMDVKVVEKSQKIKLDKEEINNIIEEIIEEDLDTSSKREKILKALKPQSTDNYEQVIKIKLNKKQV